MTAYFGAPPLPERSTLAPPLRSPTFSCLRAPATPASAPRRAAVGVARAAKKAPPPAADDGLPGWAVPLSAVTIPLSLVVCWSDYVLATTGSGLPVGEGVVGALPGAAEGLGYLACLGVVGWSALTKKETGAGLPAGPGGLVGGAEGLSWLAMAGAAVAFAAKAAQGL